MTNPFHPGALSASWDRTMRILKDGEASAPVSAPATDAAPTVATGPNVSNVHVDTPDWGADTQGGKARRRGRRIAVVVDGKLRFLNR